jgi:hypothetical protein
MPEIKFKATRKIHSSGYAIIDKSGDLQYDFDPRSKDGIWLYLKNGNRIVIDCDYKTKEFRIFFDEQDVVNNNLI